MKRVQKGIGLFFGICGILILLSTCVKEIQTETSNKKIVYAKTQLGGCNVGDNSTAQKSAVAENDKVLFSKNQDTLYMFVGLNYICCAPFTSEAKVIDDSIVITISDTCSPEKLDCYCRCMCYYTWNFAFIHSSNKTYSYKVILNNPREKEPIIIKQGEVRF